MEANSTTPVPGVPPPITPPPVISVQPAQKPKRRGWIIFGLVLVGVTALFVLVWLSMVVADFMTVTGRIARVGGPRLEEVVLEDTGAAANIVVIEVEGLITEMIERGGHTMVELIKAQLKRAAEDKRVRAVVLKVNSPGGEALAADRINSAIAEFQKKTRKPVVASLGNLAASGAYYISVPCRWIVAHDMTITGSIGVMLSRWNYRGLMDKVGILPMVYKSGKYKDMLSGERLPSEITDEERQMVQALIDEVYARFRTVVAEGRKQANDLAGQEGRMLNSDWEEYADGRVFSGREAFKLGFVDELGDFEAAVKRAKKLAGITEANLVKYRQRVELVYLLGLSGPGNGKVVKLDIGVELPKLQPGRLYFVAPEFLN